MTEEEQLTGGNTHAEIVRIGTTVRRPTGPWTPNVHELLRHLERAGFDGAPRAHGIDDQGREVITYVEGPVVHPARHDLIADDAALGDVARTIRAYHDVVEAFVPLEGPWSDLAHDPVGPHEIVCHGDLAPWNLVRTAHGWVFIDWDTAAPGRRSWDLGWAVMTLVPFFDGSGLDPQRVAERLKVFCDAYGPHLIDRDLIGVAAERAVHDLGLIEGRGGRGEMPFARLLAEGHARTWRRTLARIDEHHDLWSAAVT